MGAASVSPALVLHPAVRATASKGTTERSDTFDSMVPTTDKPDVSQRDGGPTAASPHAGLQSAVGGGPSEPGGASRNGGGAGSATCPLTAYAVLVGDERHPLTQPGWRPNHINEVDIGDAAGEVQSHVPAHTDRIEHDLVATNESVDARADTCHYFR